MDGSDTFILALAGEQTIRTISSSHIEMLRVLDAHDGLEIDLAEAEEIDLSLVQLIECARNTAALAHKNVALTHPASGALEAMLGRGGFLDASDPARRAFWLHDDDGDA